MSKGSLPKAALASEAWRLLLEYFLANRERMARIAGEFDLTLAEMRALISLEAEAPKPMGALAEGWKCDASNVTWIIDRLEERGVAERRGLPRDRRVKTVVVTPAGENLKRELLSRIHEPPDELAALSRRDLQGLLGALEKLPAASPKAQD